MDSARRNDAATQTPPATKRSVVMPDVTDNTGNTESAATDDKSDKQPEKQPAQQSVEKSAAQDESEETEERYAGKDTAKNAAEDTDTAAEKKSNTDTKSSDFNIAEMFD